MAWPHRQRQPLQILQQPPLVVQPAGYPGLHPLDLDPVWLPGQGQGPVGRARRRRQDQGAERHHVREVPDTCAPPHASRPRSRPAPRCARALHGTALTARAAFVAQRASASARRSRWQSTCARLDRQPCFPLRSFGGFPSSACTWRRWEGGEGRVEASSRIKRAAGLSEQEG